MTDPDRGAYTPQTDAPLAFDARRTRGTGGGGGGPAPFTLIVSAVVLVVVVAAIVMFYRSGVRGSNEAPQVVGSPVDSVKAPPPATEQSGEAPPLDVYNAGADQGAAGAAAPAPAFAPAPEQPMARPAPPALPPPAAQPTTPVAAAPLRPAQTAPTPVAPAPAAPVALKPAVTPAVKPPAPKPAPAVVVAKPAPVAASKPAVVVATPAVKPAPKPAASGPTGIVVQIGAYSSAALADQGWADAAKLLPGQTAGRTKKVEPVVKGTATLYRAYIGGFASRSEAEAYCAAYKAQGKSCFVKG